MISRRNTIIATSYSKCTIQATNALWFGEVQASVAKCKFPGCSCSVVIRFIQIHASNQQTWRTLAMCSSHLSNEALMLRLCPGMESQYLVVQQSRVHKVLDL